MCRCLSVLLLLILPGAGLVHAADDPAEQEVRQAARTFGQAMLRADASLLRTILPQQGKVQLRLVVLGPEEGFFSPNQVEALLESFLKQSSVRSFDLLHLEHDRRGLALARGRAVLTDRQGRPARVELHLSFVPEQGRCVLREIREAHP